MHINRHWVHTFLAGLAIVIVALAWIFFAPIPLGGQTSYVIITGNSMEPLYHTGDLVIARASKVYSVGDLVAYRDPDLSRFIIHRIISQTFGHFVLKGDHNTWFDSYQPSAQEILGKVWVHIPAAGKLFIWIRTPWIITLVTGITGGVIMLILLTKSKKKTSRKTKTVGEVFNSVKHWFASTFFPRNHPATKGKKQNRRSSDSLLAIPLNDRILSNLSLKRKPKKNSAPVETLLFVFGIIFFGSLILAVFAFANPLTINVPADIQYQQTGNFSYTGVAPQGVYDSEKIVTGAPVFPKLTCNIALQFDYALNVDQLQDAGGTHQIIAKVVEPQSKWQRTMILESQRSFSGNTFSSVVNLNLCDIESLASSFEAETDLKPFEYSLVINPNVQIQGIVNNLELNDSFQSSLVFQFDKIHFYLAQPDPQVDPLRPVQIGIIKNNRLETNTLNILGYTPTVLQARRISIPGLLASFIGILILIMIILRTAKENEEVFVRMKYGSLLVDVGGKSSPSSGPLVDVLSMDDLAKMAEKNNSVILHEVRGIIHNYYVQDNHLTYRFTLGQGGEVALADQDMSMKEGLRQGIERGEFKVYYQPIVSLENGKVASLEALLRWQHPQSGLISAKEFILAAEATGLIDVIGEWMLQVACNQLRQWRKINKDLRISVNFSQRQLAGNLVESIKRVLSNTGLEASALQVEIPETSLVQARTDLLPVLQKLQGVGIEISVDNYTGTSSIGSYETISFSSVKIDRHVIETTSNKQGTDRFIRLMDNLQNRGVNVVAEGVETEEQLQFLRSHAIHLAQGFLLGLPAPAAEITTILQDQNAR
jgi:signal peptidase I